MIRFDRHTCLAKACETGVAEFVAGRVPEARPSLGDPADLVRAALRERIAGARTTSTVFAPSRPYCARLAPSRFTRVSTTEIVITDAASPASSPAAPRLKRPAATSAKEPTTAEPTTTVTR